MTYHRHSIVHLSCVVIKDKSGNKHLSLFCSSNDMDLEETFIDSDMMLYVIGRIQKKEMEIFVDGLVDVANGFWIKVALKWYSNRHHQEYRDLGQLICWFARILLLTIEV
ncbi:hypothetical protein V1477_021110 [Vespula maculifrons]|uniref:Uncharacterized protein n=1 Tax=Vespula maculifrons TaxID=7453 RepID=A0ABD2AH73_VESMC